MLTFLYPLLSPVFWGIMNVVDKYVVTRKVKKPLGYTAVTGLANLVFALIMLGFFSWKGIRMQDLLFPALGGVVWGIGAYLYFMVLEKEDVSPMVGLVYFYPVVVAVLSYVFLHERLTIPGYVGAALCVLGVLALSLRLQKIQLRTKLWLIVLMIITTGTMEFLFKLSTDTFPALQGATVTLLVFSLTILSGLSFQKIRNEFRDEVKNFFYAAGAEGLGLLGLVTLYVAMSYYPATLVSVVSSTQPLVVLFFEYIVQRQMGDFVKDQKMIPKLTAILLIVVGVALMYLEM